MDWYLYTSSVGVYRQDDVLEEDSVWKTFPTENDTYPGGKEWVNYRHS